MDFARLVAFENEINTVASTYGLMGIEKRYPDLQSPYFYFILGKAAYYKLEYNILATGYFSKAINYGINSKEQYLGTPHADPIAQSILEMLSIRKFELEIEYRLFASAYIFFSSLVDANGPAVYNSCEGRALLLTQHKDKIGLQSLLKKYYYSGDDIVIEMLTVGDFFNASIGYNSENEIENSDRTKELAIAQAEFLFQHPNYPMLSQIGLSNIIKLSNENSSFFYQNILKDFKNNAFDITPL